LANDIEEKVNDYMEKVVGIKQDYIDVFTSDAGKRVLDDLKKKAFFHKTTFTENPGRFARNEGQRSLVVSIDNTMSIDVKETEKSIRKQLELQGENDNVE